MKAHLICSWYFDFYSPYISHSQWHWDIYHNNHHELQNDNPRKIRKKGDGWNDENFSVITKHGTEFTIHKDLIARAYPRRVNGNLIHFYFQDKVKNKNKESLNWTSLNIPSNSILENHRYALMSWSNQNDTSVKNEIYIPSTFSKNKITIIQNNKVHAFRFTGKDISIGNIKAISDSGVKSGIKLFVPSKKGLQYIFILSGSL